MRQSPNDCPHLSQVPLSVVWPRAGTVSCATRTSPHSEQRLPSVSPVFVQVGSTAGITSSTWVCLSVLPLLVFPPLVFPAFPPPQATRGSVIATASNEGQSQSDSDSNSNHLFHSRFSPLDCVVYFLPSNHFYRALMHCTAIKRKKQQ